MKATYHGTKSNRHVSRRRFVTHLAAAAAGTAALAAQSSATDAARADQQSPGDSVDVLVVGGGTAGAIAAIQAARAGAQTLLFEMGGQLGGTTTTGGVAYPGLFHAWGRQVVAGIGWELVLKAVQLDTGILPNFAQPPQRHSEHQVRVNGPLYAAMLEEAFLEAGGRLRYYELPHVVRPIENGYELELVPQGSRNLMIAGRSVSSDRPANSALRVQASCMAMGQAAGAAAALAASAGLTPSQVPLTKLREVLKQHGAIVPNA